MLPIDRISTRWTPPAVRPKPASTEPASAAPQDGVVLSGTRASGWKDALGLGLFGSGLVAVGALPWVGGALLASSLVPLSGRLSQAGQLLHRAGEKISQGLTGAITSQVEGWTNSYAEVPKEGPARDEHLMRKMLRSNQQQFGENSIYTLSNHLGLGQHYHSQGKGIEAASHYEKALTVFESELKERGEIDSLHKLVPSCLPGSAPDAASLYEKAADFFRLYGGAEKARPLLERALELCPPDASRERRSQLRAQLAELHVSAGEPQKALPLLNESWSEALQELSPQQADLAPHAEALARIHRELGDHQRSEDYWGLSLGMGASKSSVSLNVLARQYAKLGHSEQAFDLRQQAEVLSLEESTAKMGAVSQQLAKDLTRLEELYASRGDESARVRVQNRLAVVQTRLAARGPLQM